jgi:hypothetical protein
MTKENTTAPAAETAVVKNDEASATNLTAYQAGPAVVRENRVLTLGKGRSRVFIGGLPSQFVEGSSTVVSVKGTGKFKLGAKSLRPANLTQQALLHQSIGSKITLIEESKAGEERKIEGELVHIVDGRYAVLKTKNEGEAVLVVPLTQKFELNNGIPAGLSNLTVLVMEPTVETAGEFDMKLLYETNGINWAPWFEVFYNAKTKKLDRFACYVDITNNSGAKIENAVLKLIAGTNNSDAANRAARKGRGGVRMAAMAMSASLESAGGGGMEMADFSQEAAEVESVGEQKMYKLVDPVTLENGVPNSPALVFCTDVPVEHEYHAHHGYYQSLDGENREDLPKQPVMVKLRLMNSAAKNLGQALPPGSVRIFEPDSAGEMQKTDSSQVTQHVAVDEAFALDLRTPCRDLKHTRELIDWREDPAEVEDEVEVTPEGGLETDTDEDAGDATEALTPRITAMMPAMSAAVEGGADKKKKEKKQPKPRFREEEREIVLHNFKDEAVEVIVHENVPHNAEFLTKSQDFAKFNAGQGNGTFKVTVPAKSEKACGSASVKYRIKYRIN